MGQGRDDVHRSARAARRLRVLIVLATANVRGAETEGRLLGSALSSTGEVDADVVALVPASPGSESLPVEVIGRHSRSLSTLRALRRHARRADVVIAFGSTTLPACAAGLIGSERPFVYRSIGDPAQWVRSALHRARTAQLIRRSSHVVALWSGARSRLIELYGLPRLRVSVIPNARSGDRLQVPSPAERRQARQHLGLPEQDDVVLYLGALSPEKQVDRAIQAISSVPNAVLAVVGAGSERARLEAHADRAAPGRVLFFGAINDPLPALHAADALVLTSRTEGMPGAVIEASLCGVPVVAPDVGALSEMIEHGREGLLTDGSVECTATALREALAGRAASGQAVRAAALQRFDLHTTVAAWVELLRSVAA